MARRHRACQYGVRRAQDPRGGSNPTEGSGAMARTTTPLTDHVAIVTGAGQGIGKASALALAEAGATVVAVDINEGTLAETAGELRKLGARTLAIRADLG